MLRSGCGRTGQADPAGIFCLLEVVMAERGGVGLTPSSLTVHVFFVLSM